MSNASVVNYSQSKIHSDDKPFLTGRIKKLIIKRDKAYRKGRLDQYRSLKRQVASEIRIAKSIFYEKQILPIQQQNPKAWWRNIKKIVGNKKVNVSLLDPVTGALMDDKQTANYINAFFSSLTKDFTAVDRDWANYGETEELPIVTELSVERKLTNLNVGKAPGHNDPHAKVLKTYANIFAVPLAHIFNDSFRSKKFPKAWKTCDVCPIPKTNPCTSVEDIRPISLTSYLSKMQESYVVEWLYEDIKHKITESQFGGLPGSSAVMALVNLVHRW